MFVMEKESGDVVAMSIDGVETRISIVEAQNGRFILAIDAPPGTQLVNIEPKKSGADLQQLLRANYRQELLMF